MCGADQLTRSAWPSGLESPFGLSGFGPDSRDSTHELTPEMVGGIMGDALWALRFRPHASQTSSMTSLHAEHVLLGGQVRDYL